MGFNSGFKVLMWFFRSASHVTKRHIWHVTSYFQPMLFSFGVCLGTYFYISQILMHPTSWDWVFLQKPSYSLDSVQREGSLPCSNKDPPPVSITSQINPVHDLAFYVLKIHFKIILPSTPTSSNLSLFFRFPNQNVACLSFLRHGRHIFHQFQVLDLNTSSTKS